MTDDRLRRWLEFAEQPLAPDAAFAAALREELRQELGFVPASTLLSITRRIGGARVRGRHGPTQLLLAATLLVAGAVGLTAVAGSLLERSIEPQPDLLAEIRQTGRIRIAIRPDHPQFTAPGQPAAGFDADVARALADHLGVRGDIVVADASAMLSGHDDLWDIALPSEAVWELDPSRFLVTMPYYRWPHRLAVPEASSATGPADLASEPICAVAGDGGEAWLRGAYGDARTAPVTVEIVTRPSDEACLAALDAGEVVAVVTARLSDADLQVRPGIKVVGGPEPEPRPVIIRRAQGESPEPTPLLAAIDYALDEMRRDGTLTRLSQNRFGGADLTTP